MSDYSVGKISSLFSKTETTTTNARLASLFQNVSQSKVMTIIPVVKKENESTIKVKNSKCSIDDIVVRQEELAGKKIRKRKQDSEDSDDDGFKERFRSRKKKKVKQTRSDDDRTIFVGNLPYSCSKKNLKKMFKKFGKIETIRFRSAAPMDPQTPKKLVVITHDFHSDRTSLNAYIKFSLPEEAIKAVEMNGSKIDKHHIRVDYEARKNQYDHHRSVFVGNLPFNIEEEEVRKYFKECGPVEGVRLIRESSSGLGKGFGYILFKDSGSAFLALKLNGKELENRSLRIQKCLPISKQKEKNHINEFTGSKKQKQRTIPAGSEYQGETAKKQAAWKFFKDKMKFGKKKKKINLKNVRHKKKKVNEA